MTNDVDEVAGRLRVIAAAQAHLAPAWGPEHAEDARLFSRAAALLLSQAGRIKELEEAVKEIIRLAQSERSDPVAETPRELRAILNRIEWAARYSPAGDLYQPGRLSSQGEG